jgi:uncharacterized membrane protein
MSEQPIKKTSTGIQENVEGLLCYLAGWITGLIFFLIEKESKFVRFHAMQSIAVSVVLIGVYFILGLIPIIGWLLVPVVGLISFVVWIILMLKAYQGKLYKLPIIGDFAAKQAGL